MSATYSAEPPTEGAALLHTTHGALHLRLWPRDAPHACKLFATHLHRNLFASLPFHHVVPNLLVQSGRVSPTSSSSSPVRAERCPRLRFRRRGLVALLADQAPDASHPTVHTQFFVTLADAPFFNAKHPIVATVVGHSVFNLLNIASAVSDHLSNPPDLPRILSSALTDSPFPDIPVSVHPPKSLQSPPSLPPNSNHNNNPRRLPVTAAKPVRSDNLLSFRRRTHDDNDDDDDDDDDDDNLNAMAPLRNRRNPRTTLTTPDPSLNNINRPPPNPPRRKPLRRALSTNSLTPPSDTPPSNPAAPTPPNAAPASSNPASADIISAANAQFEKLRQQLVEPNSSDNNPSIPALKPPNSPLSNDPSNQQHPSAPPASVPPADPSAPPINPVEKRRRDRDAEGEVLRRLHAFESALALRRRRPPRASPPNPSSDPPHNSASRASTDGSDADDDPPQSNPSSQPHAGPWFSRGLRLRPPSDDEGEYDIIDSAPQPRRIKRHRPSR